jgi:diguanylate cyclase (GGDEF)-like protein
MHRISQKERARLMLLAVVTVVAACASLTYQVAAILAPGWIAGSGFYSLPIPLVCTAAVTLTVSYFLYTHISALKNAGDLAYVDELTGLANRRQFDARLRAEIARSGRQSFDCAVLYMDLDRFKHINDTYGHEAGDEVIKQFALRIAANVRAGDFVARLSGDEFAAIVTDVASNADVEAVSQRIFNAMSAPIRFKSKQVYANVSIGAAVVEAGRIGAEEALRRADFALFQAKEAGRNNVQIFTPHMEERIRTRGELENDLRDAIANNRFELADQPLISQADRKILGVEAFVRWIHPERGPVPPSVFIPIAEQIGMIDKLGNIILRRACMETKPLEPIKLAVNVSPVQFMQASFVQSVRDILESTGFPPGRLELEITEGVFRNDGPRTREAIAKLRSLGVRIAVDDFGTGFSSMAYLRDFPLDRIKIDRSFISEIESSGQSLNIVSHMIELGRSLGLSVTVEGVETVDQLELLKAKGLNELQGYLFSRPLKAAELATLDLDASLGGHTPAVRNPPLRLVS